MADHNGRTVIPSNDNSNSNTVTTSSFSASPPNTSAPSTSSSPFSLPPPPVSISTWHTMLWKLALRPLPLPRLLGHFSSGDPELRLSSRQRHQRQRDERRTQQLQQELLDLQQQLLQHTIQTQTQQQDPNQQNQKHSQQSNTSPQLQTKQLPPQKRDQLRFKSQQLQLQITQRALELHRVLYGDEDDHDNDHDNENVNENDDIIEDAVPPPTTTTTTNINNPYNTAQQQHKNHNDNEKEQDDPGRGELGPLGQQLVQLRHVLNKRFRRRQFFLERYGCTGWTDEVMDELVSLALMPSNKKQQCRGRGIVEIGAGNGQWSRQIHERYDDRQKMLNKQENETNDNNENKEDLDSPIVLAYDNFSAVPLHPAVYHAQTQPHQDYFGRVQPISRSKSNQKNTVEAVLEQECCRGRVLLLVYPSPPNPTAPNDNDMAAEALQAYMRSDPIHNDTVVYVGEGRGGVNASDRFFDVLEHAGSEWALMKILPVHSLFQKKGVERMYVFQRFANQKMINTLAT